ncbi:MAG: flagellar hook-associated protein FlgK [Alphaproteobacteria bacterium]|nr:flagellar hook-associated protein FlgK [Alphaproteobacteria bacterium]MDE1984908.1 flagellar hook-associated protein FlgK [Alphaproteobacteria bacterium]MDE2163603.1 flagellar hook-associated protein FlgK [Alphaproteobacteria bacterium]MDE2265682.1 flagellar hook-associated protein FlgK [Alphaproteobacteria bacterium]MDE2500600.1 flagellar hook-associated protein FlgK [Alphaproteobacteria bacterium]
MSLNGIMSSALSALKTNSSALSIVSNNVANMNTTGYARRVVNLQTLSAGGQVAGVDIADVQRVVDQYLNQEALSAGASASNYDTQSSVYNQINALLGSPGDGTALTSKLSNVFTALGQAALSPTSSSSQTSTLNAFQDFASSVSSLSSSLSDLQQRTDGQVASTANSASGLIKQIYDFNQQITTAYAAGNTSSALLDQRDTALQSLSQLMDVRTAQQADGTVTVMTQDGVSLVGSNSYATLSYTAGGSSGTYQSIMLQTVNPQSGQPIGTSQALDPHLSGGQLEGLLQMRDGTIADLQNELGAFAQGVAQSFNQQHNANTAFPPPTTMTGRNTGLLSTDALNFTGKTTVAVTDSSGNLVESVNVDFGTNKYSTDGGSTWTAFPSNTVGGLTSALNTALGANGTASFTNGELSISATGTNGIVVQDDATTPANRGGVGFSQFFGLNDLFQSAAPSILSTGLSASDSSGLAAGSEIDLSLKGPNGDVPKTATVTITAGMTIGNVVSALNTAMGGTATFTLNSDGSITTAPSSSYPGYQLQVSADTTQRGTTGMSFTEMFGIGANQQAQQAASFSVNPAIVNSPSRLAFGQANLSASGPVVGSSDSSGLLALQNLETKQQTFSKAGSLAQQATSLGNYAASLYQDIATRGTNVATNKTAQDARLTEAQTRQSSVSGVNLDEELSNMMIYQRAYSAGARLLTVADQLYQTLLQIQ